MFQTLIASATVGAGGATNIDFSAIPGTFTDLVLVVSARSGSAGDVLWVRFNNDSSTLCTHRWLNGDGSSTFSSNAGGNSFIRLGTITSGDTANTFTSFQVTIPNYSGSANKTVAVDGVNENNATTAHQRITTGIWPVSSAITQITISNNGSSISQHSTAYLYGTLKGSGGASVA